MSIWVCSGFPWQQSGAWLEGGGSCSAWADRFRSVLPGSWTGVGDMQEGTAACRRRRLVWWSRSRPSGRAVDGEGRVSFGIRFWSLIWFGGGLRRDATVRRSLAAARRRGEGLLWRREWTAVALARCGWKGSLGRVSVFGPDLMLAGSDVIGLCWFLVVSSCSVLFCLSVVVLLTISPSQRGLGLSVLSGSQHDGDSSLHGVWQFWITVSERVNRFIFLLVAGLYRYNQVWLVLGIASQDWLLSCCLVGFRLFTVVVLLTISPSSFERGLVLSVPSGCQYDGDSPLHVIWQFWIAVSDRVNLFIFLLVAGLYRYSRVWLFLEVASQVWLSSNVACRRKIWFGIESFWLMVVICFDSPVTVVPQFFSCVVMLCNMLNY